MTYRKVLVFWLPLALAWVLMTMEGPWIQGVISRKPDSETQLAAFGLMFSLSVLIETPVIMLLATGSALARNRQSFYVLWRFMMMVNVGVTIIAVLMAFTPLLDFYFGVMLHIPGHIIEATRPGMQIMIFWGGIIGFRRFHQGIIIRFGNTRVVGYGTVLRVIVSGSVALALGALTLMTGAVIGALALVLAVAAEAIFIHRVSRADVGRLLQTPLADKLQKLSYRDALRFHMPLAATSFVTLGIHPVIERGLASMPDATQSLAAWPVIFSILLVSRSGGMAYQEVVIALDASEQHHRVLRGFTLRLGFGLSLLMVIFVFSPLIEVYNSSILQVPRHLHHLVLLGTQAAFLVPLLTTLQSYLRALLMLSRKTATIYQAIILGFVVTTIIVWGGIDLGMHGVLAAALGLTIGQIIELAFLYIAYRRQNDALRLHWQSMMVPAVGD